MTLPTRTLASQVRTVSLPSPGRLHGQGTLRAWAPDASMSVKRVETGADAVHVSGQLPISPRCFGCWRSLRSCSRRRPVYPQGKGREIPGGNQRRRSAAGTFPGPQAPTKEGLDRPERTRTIRRNLNDVVNGYWRATPASRPVAGRLSGPSEGALGIAMSAARSIGTYFSARYRRIASRRGPVKASY